jgi:hypothetical protein
MLHIVNGDSFGGRLKKSGIPGEILVWRESLYEGPIGLDLAEAAILQARAQYLDDKYGIPAKQFIDITLQQEAFLRACGSEDQVVLWFEHDLYDQLMLSYILYKLANSSHAPRAQSLYLLCIGNFPGVEHFQGLGQLCPEQILSLEGKWKEITPVELQLGCKAWEAYAASEPFAVEDLVRSDNPELPYLRDALQLHLQRFPSARNGLNQLQQLVLNLVRNGESSLMGLFRQMGLQVSGYGLGDLQFWGIIEGMRNCSHPLIALIGGERLPRFNEPLFPELEAWRLTLTDVGIAVLDEVQDHVKLNGIEEWFGGVYVSGTGPIWRWNADMKRVVKL